MPDFTHTYAQAENGDYGTFSKSSNGTVYLTVYATQTYADQTDPSFFPSLDTLGVYLNRTCLNLLVVRDNEIYTVA